MFPISFFGPFLALFCTVGCPIFPLLGLEVPKGLFRAFSATEQLVPEPWQIQARIDKERAASTHSQFVDAALYFISAAHKWNTGQPTKGK